MSTERYEQNFGTCELGDRRLTRRALSIGQALSEKFGEGLSSVFSSAKELKRAYAFSLIQKRTLNSSSDLIVR
ncbi:MAG: transposase DNA-binding-containing protein [Cyanobacteria bacterium P01_F01_bin.53]